VSQGVSVALAARGKANHLADNNDDPETADLSLPIAVQASNAPAIPTDTAAPRPVAAWLFGVCGLIFLMVVVGGVTRLTLSGLSITEWHPIIGVVPPLTEAQWAAAFRRYQQVPEYRALHYGMSLADFKSIYFWEYAHRLLGRLIGVAFALPLVWFWLKGRLPRRLAPALLGILALGFAQGFLGWYMVESGLADRLEVSQYRLVAHLILALAIYSLILWTALGLLNKPSPPIRGEREGPVAQQWEGEVGARTRSNAPHLTPSLSAPGGGEGAFLWRRAAEVVIVLVGLTIAAGGFVAGTRAGLIYNTFPLMDGRFVPAGYAALEPFVRNWFENVTTIQFDHRLLAETTFVVVIMLTAVGMVWPPLPRPALAALGAAVLGQAALGISTLLSGVPVPLAAAHQAGAVLLLTAAIVFRHTLRPCPLMAKAPPIL
jgi:heme a synthase